MDKNTFSFFVFIEEIKMKSWALLSSNLPSVIDVSMTRGKLLDNDTQLFILISILIMTQLHPRDPENRQQNRFSERRFSKKKPQLQPVEWESVAWLTVGLIGK